jgi:hypothetical protein
LTVQTRTPKSIWRTEELLAQMEPIERAILALPAAGMEGVAVKARVAAQVVSNYWDIPLDRLDLDAKVLRLLIEAICSVAGLSLPVCRMQAAPVRR